jgi:hypothetical protein
VTIRVPSGEKDAAVTAPYFLNFMFNPLPGRIGAKIEQMRQERKLRFWEIGRVEHAGGGPSTYSSSTNTVSNAWFYTETGTGESTLYPNESCRVWTICLIPWISNVLGGATMPGAAGGILLPRSVPAGITGRRRYRAAASSPTGRPSPEARARWSLKRPGDIRSFKARAVAGWGAGRERRLRELALSPHKLTAKFVYHPGSRLLVCILFETSIFKFGCDGCAVGNGAQ